MRHQHVKENKLDIIKQFVMYKMKKGKNRVMKKEEIKVTKQVPETVRDEFQGLKGKCLLRPYDELC